MERRTALGTVHRSLADLHRLTSTRRGFADLMAAAGLDLTRPSADVLRRVCRSGPLTMGSLAAAEHQDPGATARLVSALEAGGLLHRVRSATDGRVTVVHATDEGRRVAAKVERVETDHLERALAELDDPGLLVCASVLEQLVVRLRAAAETAPPRLRRAAP